MAYSGEVKSFGPKGYGFISSGEIEGDIYFQKRDLLEDFQQVLINQHDSINLVGRGVRFELTETQDGKPQARSIQVVAVDGEDIAGEIKSFVQDKGYGFISSSSIEGDIYFQRKDIPNQFQAMQLKGLKVKFVPHTMPDGKVQARNLVVMVGNPGPVMGAPMGGMAPPMMGMPMHIAPPAGNRVPPPQGRMVQQGKGGTVRAVPPGQAPPPMMRSMPPMVGADGASMVGTVKSFDAEKGYGFITAPNFQGDIYFKPDSSGWTKDQKVTFFLKYAQNGKPQARDVAGALEEGQFVVGEVKRYNPSKGFGFFGVENRSQDVYFQKKDLPVEFQESPDLDGTRFSLQIRLTSDGKPQAQDLQFSEGPPKGVKRAAPGGDDGHDPSQGTAAKRTRPSTVPAAFARPSSAPSVAPAVGGGDSTVGMIKSYNAAKGFGFISCRDVKTDVYFQKSGLPTSLQQSQSLQGKEVSFQMHFTEDGKAQGSAIKVVFQR
eukprot:TRINITY_DN6755_c0_g1_i1.p1 TRINITY_DN6755_c0_g1~~TRINITY_DN6755_c0_g1_i1.p1  ORF type:complete len:509 (-),score=119.67 TRINITY_DN6755_c0_g1_i1:216-1679(-)